MRRFLAILAFVLIATPAAAQTAVVTRNVNLHEIGDVIRFGPEHVIAIQEHEDAE